MGAWGLFGRRGNIKPTIDMRDASRERYSFRSSLANVIPTPPSVVLPSGLSAPIHSSILFLDGRRSVKSPNAGLRRDMW